MRWVVLALVTARYHALRVGAVSSVLSVPSIRTSRVQCARCLLDDNTGHEISFSALRAEAERRNGADLGKSLALQKLGPHHTTTPKQVVEHVITQLRAGNVSQAFSFTCVPVTKRGTHKSSTDWSQRMAWEKCTVINGAPSGGFVDLPAFETMVKSRYSALLETNMFRFVGDDSPWQQKHGREPMTAVKEYVVEVMTCREEHLLLKFKLVCKRQPRHSCHDAHALFRCPAVWRSAL